MRALHTITLALTLATGGCSEPHPSPSQSGSATSADLPRDASVAQAERDAAGPAQTPASRAASNAGPAAGRQGGAASRPDAGQLPARGSAARDADAGTEDVAQRFSLDAPIEVSLELSQADWDTLRQEGRSLPATVSGCPDTTFTGYTKVRAQLTLDGETLPDVELRKKGYIGSLSVSRPSLSIDFDKDRTLAGFKRLTLNNNREDASNVHQCLAYQLYARAGLHAPRCGLAHVRINGVDKGYYTHVEPIKKPFLRRELGEDSGNLYELEAPTDLSREQAERIELKTDGRTDRSDLERWFELLTAPDDALLAQLERVVDVSELLSYTALEAMLGQWDGFSGHGTNAFLYHAARDDRFHILPWGADQAFTSIADLLGPGSVSAFASTQLMRRLWALPAWRDMYQARLRELLDTVWKPDELIAQLRAVATLTGAPDSARDATERFMRGQRQLLEDELARQPAPSPRVIAIPGACDPALPGSSQLSARWDAAARAAGGLFDALSLLGAVKPVAGSLGLDIAIHDRKLGLAPNTILSAAGVTADGSAFLGVLGSDPATRNTLVLVLMLPVDSLRPGKLAFHGYETYGVISELAPQGQRILGYIGQGSLQLDMAGAEDGAQLQGSWNGMVAAQPATP